MSINPKKNKKSLLSRSQSAWLWWRRFEEASGGCRFLLHVFLVRSPTSHSHSPHSLFPRPAASSSAVCLITDPMSFGANCSYNEYEWFSWDYSERSLTSTVVNLLCLHNSDHDRESKREGEEEEKGVPDSFTYKQTDLMHLQVFKIIITFFIRLMVTDFFKKQIKCYAPCFLPSRQTPAPTLPTMQLSHVRLRWF